MAATKATTLFSLDAVKSWLGSTSSKDDDILAVIADAVSGRLESVTGRQYVTRTGVVEGYNGVGSRALLVRHFPVIAVASLTLKRSEADTPVTLVEGADFDVDKQAGEIRARQGIRFTAGFQNIVLTYSHGFDVQDGPALPADLVQAALSYVKLVYSEKTTNTDAASSVNIGNQNFILKPGIPWGIKSVLDNWTRRRIGV